jgi:hypothetical protein
VPTATQEPAEWHETSVICDPAETAGVGSSDKVHVVPESTSANGTAFWPGLLNAGLPDGCVADPTTTQDVDDMHETDDRVGLVSPTGLLSTVGVQVEPESTSAIGTVAVFETCEPTATHEVALRQSTPLRVPESAAGSGAADAVHELPDKVSITG